MNAADRYKIISNDYTDLLFDYKSNPRILNLYPNETVNYINEQYAVLHLPADELTVDSITRYGYTAIPCLYSLQSSPTPIFNDGAYTPQTMNNLNLTGQGVLVGIIDTGIDYLSPLFRNSQGKTRILSIWDQTIDSENFPEDTFYGTEYNKHQIDLAINSLSPLDIVPSTDYIGHGTMLASIACGYDLNELNYSGIATESDLLVVKLKEAKPNLKEFLCVPQHAIAYQENDIMMAISYLVNYAHKVNRPISIFLGLGTFQGDHGGRGLLSSMISFYSSYPGYVFSVPAGNEGNRDHHFYGEIQAISNTQTVYLNVADNEYGMLLQLYSVPPSNLILEIITPTNENLGKFNPTLGGSKTVQIFYLDTRVTINNYLNEDYAILEQLIVIRINNPMPGIWKFIVSSESDLTAQYHIWLPTKAFIKRGTYFFSSNNNTTITSPGNSEKAITVTAYNTKNNTLYYYASKGNTVLNAPKPDLTAPGVDIVVPMNRDFSYSSDGTGLATAYVAGTVALLLQWGIVYGNYLNFSGVQVKKVLILGAERRDAIDYPNPDWGYGIIDLNRTLDNLNIDISGPPLL